MSATEVLRQLLDERGEHYKTSGYMTWWGRPVDSRTGEYINVYHNQAQPMGEDRLFVKMQLATPDQAVEATLGRVTCKLEWHGSLADWPDMECWSCSECGFGWHHSANDEQFSYCPNCGRKVES